MAVKIKKKEINKSFDFILLIVVLLLLGLGIIMVLSASSPSSLATNGSSYTFVIKQAIAAGLGIIGMMVISRIDYKIYSKYAKILYLISFVLLLMVLIPGVGIRMNGARRWIRVPIFGSLQPSEIAKMGIIIFFASYLSKNKKDLKGLWGGFLKPIIFYAAPPLCVILLIQSHLSASVIIVLVVSLMMIVAGCRLRYFLSFGTAGATLGITVMYFLAKFKGMGSFRLQRITSFLNPWADPQNTGWQIIQSLYAIGSGGLFGVGLGNSRQKYLYISEPHNDFIFAVLAEELGFVGCAFVIILFAMFIWRGVLISMKAPDMFGSLLAIGITALIGFQAIINIAVVTSSMPVTGMALPFFSYGGTSLIILLSAVGILLNISRQTEKL